MQDLAGKDFLARLIISCKMNLARCVQDLLESCKKSFIFTARLARFPRCVQDILKNLARLARNILARLACFLQDHFYWAFTM